MGKMKTRMYDLELLINEEGKLELTDEDYKTFTLEELEYLVSVMQETVLTKELDVDES